MQVRGPATGGSEHVDESDEVRFALTSEAGLNDGLAFPFVTAAVLAATLGSPQAWGLRWLGWELVGRTVLGVVVGYAVGFLLCRVAFRAQSPPAPAGRDG